jgi:homogentisate 1,2-dioxygenase
MNTQALPIDALRYQTGFANEFATEAVANTLPKGRNSPQRVAHGLYAEQISGTAFTAPRHLNRRTWMYRIRPGITHDEFKGMPHARWHNVFDDAVPNPNPLRWDPYPLPDTKTNFIDGLYTLCGSGGPGAQSGIGIGIYAINDSMHQRYLSNADAEMLLVPQRGRLRIATELGILEIEPQEIAVIPRGIRFRVDLLDTDARGYFCENFGSPLRLPDLGPIGSNGLANPRDFLTPVAAYEDVEGSFELVHKFQGHLFTASMDHSPLDVVGWHGNFAPYKYDLRLFNTIGSISYDHPDPSIFTVLTSPSDTPGTANLDFVIFPPRWLVGVDTFRPPWYHRNIASEFMGLVHGQYDAKEGGFIPGASSLHTCMTGHGPDARTFEKASAANTQTPDQITDTMAFMFETRCVLRTTKQAIESTQRQNDYLACWKGLGSHFRI